MKQRKPLIAPSVLSCNFLKLGEEIEMINQSEADWVHVDIMDGVFVPNISIGIPVVKAIRKVSKKPLDVHLMIVNPDKYIEQFRDAGADILTVHYEACTHLHRTLTAIKQCGMKAGVVLNPHTPVAVLEDIITECDLVLLMSVNPGFGGQAFIKNTTEKVKRCKALIAEKNAGTLIELDGGVDLHNAKMLFDSGVDVLVAGNTVFASENPKKTIAELKSIG